MFQFFGNQPYNNGTNIILLLINFYRNITLDIDLYPLRYTIYSTTYIQQWPTSYTII
jgi:hypothetical protein